MFEDAKIIEDKIKLNDRIFNQERTIKYLEDSLKNADKQIAYSNIYLRITEKAPAYADIKWVTGAELAVGLANNTGAVIYLTAVLFPYAVVITLIWLIARWIKRKSASAKPRK